MSKLPVTQFQHRFTGQTLLFTLEERCVYMSLAADMLVELDPVGILEFNWAQTIIDHTWRLRRINAVENNLHVTSAILNSRGVAADDRLEWLNSIVAGWTRSANQFLQITRYEQAVSRQLKDAYAMLHKLQKERRAKQEAGTQVRLTATTHYQEWYRSAFEVAVTDYRKLQIERKVQREVAKQEAEALSETPAA